MNKDTKIRGIIALIFTFISIALSLIFFILFLMDGENIFESLLGAPLGGFLFGGIIVGFSHISAVHKKIKGVIPVLLLIPGAGWMIYLMLIIGIPYLGGWIFMLSDLFKYWKAKKGEQS